MPPEEGETEGMTKRQYVAAVLSTIDEVLCPDFEDRDYIVISDANARQSPLVQQDMSDSRQVVAEHQQGHETVRWLATRYNELLAC